MKLSELHTFTHKDMNVIEFLGKLMDSQKWEGEKRWEFGVTNIKICYIHV